MDYVVQTIYVNESVEWSDGCVGREVGVNGGSTSSVLNVCKSVYFICSMQRDSLPLATSLLSSFLVSASPPHENVGVSLGSCNNLKGNYSCNLGAIDVVVVASCSLRVYWYW